MSPLELPVRRPVATAMLFAAMVLLGCIGWARIPVELFPDLVGDELTVRFARPGSEPEVVERELLMPLEARVTELPEVSESWGEVRGSGGRLRVQFERGADLKVRQLDLQRLASALAREQPAGTWVDVQAQDTSVLSRFVMVIHVTGSEDLDTLHDLVEERIQPRLAAVPGVSQVLVAGGGSRRLTIELDPARAAARGVTVPELAAGVRRIVGRLRSVGDVRDSSGRAAVMLDGRPRGLISLARSRVDPARPVLLQHVAEVTTGPGREQTLFRIDGRRSAALIVFQEAGTNVVRLGRALRARVQELREEHAPLGLELTLGFDGAELIEEQIDRLLQLAFVGFAIGLLVLYLFLSRWRAVLVVAVAVPVSLLSALALFYVGGLSLNLISLFGLAVGVGMLVDNSVVVYEAVQRGLERGATPGDASVAGVRRTVRAILAASVTTAIVFLPAALTDFESALIRSLLEIVALAILLPLAASLLVAVGLVPLLARVLAAPSALRRLAELRERRARSGGLRPPDRFRALFSGVLQVALRRPTGWLAGLTLAVLVTIVVALPWVAVTTASRQPTEADELRLSVRLTSSRSLEAATGVFDRLERALMEVDGVDGVESFVQERGGSLTVKLQRKDERPAELSLGRLRQVATSTARELSGVEILRPGEADEAQGGGGGGAEGVFGQAPARVVISGPDQAELAQLADELRERLESIPQVASVWHSTTAGDPELRVILDPLRLASFGLTSDQVLPVLRIAGREGIEMRTGYADLDGRELPVVVKGPRRELSPTALRGLRLATPAGVLPVDAVAEVRRMPPPAALEHHNGRRETVLSYRLGENVPDSGPARVALDSQIASAVRHVHRPPGYSVELDAGEDQTSWFKRLLLLVVLLLYLVLAVTFESLTLPALVLLSLPLTLLGATWALVLAGMPLDAMAMVGALALMGLTVNPAILLVDRMQQRALLGHWSAGAAALAAVRERTRPVLMTTATTVAGLWPLALVTGRENEIWPPFATIVMGGLVTSTLLTLLVMPVGFVLLRRLDLLLGRLGPWAMIGWIAVTTGTMTALIRRGVLTSLTWQSLTTLLVAGALLGLIVLVFRRSELPEPAMADGPPAVEVRCLGKTYALPGPVGRAWRLPQRFARQVLDRGGTAFDPADARDRLPALLLVTLGLGYLAVGLQSLFWRLVFLLVTAAAASFLLLELRRARGRADALGRATSGGVEGWLAVAAPWLAVAFFAERTRFAPLRAGATPESSLFGLGCLVAFVALLQLGRSTARRIAAGRIPERVTGGALRHVRSQWRWLARRLFGLDLPREEVPALRGVQFRIEGGMIGILGPNGAGKTTLLRQLAGILEPSHGRITLGGVPMSRLRRHLGRWVGYLPQDAALPSDLTAREYLEYYALLYDIPPDERAGRIGKLLEDVGLAGRADERVGGYSGGMRQRVAVARTLLRLPPVIIVDEPTVGLDPRERLRFRNLLVSLSRGRVVLFSTHVVEDVAVACERILVLARGRLVFDGRLPELAGAAAGRVWRVDLPAGGEKQLLAGARVAGQTPGPDGSSQLRILSDERPHPAARPVDPTLEEGYLALVEGGPL